MWARVEGGTGPPLTPAVWLQGDPGEWQPRDEHHVHLWHALRIAVLSAAWALRCRRAARGTQFTPADVAVVDFELAWCGGGVVAYVAHRQGRAPAMEFRLDPPLGALV